MVKLQRESRISSCGVSIILQLDRGVDSSLWVRGFYFECNYPQSELAHILNLLMYGLIMFFDLLDSKCVIICSFDFLFRVKLSLTQACIFVCIKV